MVANGVRWGLLAGIGCLLAVGACDAGPVVTIGANVPAGQRVEAGQIDHSDWNALLARFVDAKGYVDYAGWQSAPDAVRALDGYLNRLSAASFGPTTSREVQLAFWINAYNAVTIKGILREYPTSSIRNHTAKLFGYNIWKDLQLLVSGKPYSLDAMEHEILRKMGEPRIHFAIVCASVGCPPLRNEAYVAARIDQQLTDNAQVFFADPSKLQFDVNAGTLEVSPILSWFAADFGANAAEQLRIVAPYMPAAAQALAGGGRARVSYLDYDWGLNDQAKLGRAATR